MINHLSRKSEREKKENIKRNADNANTSGRIYEQQVEPVTLLRSSWRIIIVLTIIRIPKSKDSL